MDEHGAAGGGATMREEGAGALAAPVATAGGDLAESATVGRHALGLLERFGIILVWGVMVLVLGLLNPRTYPTWSNFSTIFTSQAVLLILALALLVPLTVGEFDLSVAGTLGFTFVLSSDLLLKHNLGLVPCLVLMAASALVIGVVNGLIIVGLRVPSLVVTLGTGTILYGVGYAILSGPIGGLNDGLTSAMQASVGGLQVPSFIGVGFVVVLVYVYNFRPLGRVLYFTGINREATRLSGVRIDRLRFGSFIAAALIAAAAGVILTGLDGGGDPSTAQSYLLPVFAAVFLGGAVITPGRVNPLGTFVSVYFLASGVTGLEIAGLTGWVEQVFYGGALVIGVSIARLHGR